MEPEVSLRTLLRDRQRRRQLLRELCEDGDLADTLLDILLHVQGYDNPQNGLVSGEDFLITVVLARLGVRHCLDVGAAQGHYSRLLLQALPECQVCACEPLPLNLPILEAMARRYSERFTLMPFALGAMSGEGSLFYEEARPQLATFCRGLDPIDYIANDQAVVVPMRTIDELWLTTPHARALDFIKIDAEGWERDILDGATATLRQLKPLAVQLEFNRHHLFRGHTFFSLARRLKGYQAFQLLPRRLVRRDPAAPLTNLFQFSNFVFIRDDCIPAIRSCTV